MRLETDEVRTLMTQYRTLQPLSSGGGNDPTEGPEMEGEGQTLTKYRPKVKRPSLYKVILLNDDFTPQDFVVFVLRKFFHKTEDEAVKIMLQVHHQGAGVAGVYSFEVAETKVYLVNEFSRSKQHPLKCIMEKESSSDED